MRVITRGISATIAIILIIAVAVASVAVTYIWYSSLQSRVQESTERHQAEVRTQQHASIRIEKITSAWLDEETIRLYIWVRNTGNVDVTIDVIYATIYVGELAVRTSFPPYLVHLSPGQLSHSLWVTIPYPSQVSPQSAPPENTVITVKVCTKEGAEAVSSIIVSKQP